VVPAKVVFSIDLRHDSADVVQALGERVKAVCAEERGRCDVRVEELLYDPPLQFPQAMRAHVAQAADALGLARRDLPSPAGHDSRYLHYYCPTGMLFIPCRGGISHNEAESITPDEAWNGARVLADVLVRLADAP
jgi:N-carbamoyl-L-amino-acid hydrolase